MFFRPLIMLINGFWLAPDSPRVAKGYARIGQLIPRPGPYRPNTETGNHGLIVALDDLINWRPKPRRGLLQRGVDENGRARQRIPKPLISYWFGNANCFPGLGPNVSNPRRCALLLEPNRNSEGCALSRRIGNRTKHEDEHFENHTKQVGRQIGRDSHRASGSNQSGWKAALAAPWQPTWTQGTERRLARMLIQGSRVRSRSQPLWRAQLSLRIEPPPPRDRTSAENRNRNQNKTNERQ